MMRREYRQWGGASIGARRALWLGSTHVARVTGFIAASQYALLSLAR